MSGEVTTRVTLISPAVGRDLREVRFAGEGPVDAEGLRRARSAAGNLPAADRVAVSPSRRCRDTAVALGLAPDDGAVAPTGWDVGRWRGRTLDEVTAQDPGAVREWLTDPSGAPHGGESLTGLRERVGGWLDATVAGTGRMVAVVEPDVVRAAVVHALGVPDATFWRIDAGPLAAVALTGRSGRWNLRVGTPLDR
ncbi:histidine phosphatase family protein [Streptomyces sp. NPDC058001]|uniref:histidine phosphatase family protein n=1 Tax=Streptomyces sp. NPDC058001 TaxID=3346300 RepID=UPI0036F16BDC